MLYSVSIGMKKVPSFKKNDADQYGNKYLVADDIRQKIRLGKKLPDEFDAVESGDSSILVYHTPKSTISNNWNNLNISMFSLFDDHKDISEKSLVYITIDSSNHDLIDYQVKENNEIIQTYRSRSNHYIGCCLCVEATDTKTNVMSIFVKNELEKINYRYDLYIEGDKLTVTKNEALKNEVNDKLRKLGNKWLKTNHFKMVLKPDHLITNTFIVGENEEGEATDYLQQAKPSAVVLTLPNVVIEALANNKSVDEELATSIDNLFTTQIKDARIRAVTLYGSTIKLPKDFCRRYNITYLFRYTNHEITCLRCM